MHAHTRSPADGLRRRAAPFLTHVPALVPFFSLSSVSDLWAWEMHGQASTDQATRLKEMARIRASCTSETIGGIRIAQGSTGIGKLCVSRLIIVLAMSDTPKFSVNS